MEIKRQDRLESNLEVPLADLTDEFPGGDFGDVRLVVENIHETNGDKVRAVPAQLER